MYKGRFRIIDDQFEAIRDIQQALIKIFAGPEILFCLSERTSILGIQENIFTEMDHAFDYAVEKHPIEPDTFTELCRLAKSNISRYFKIADVQSIRLLTIGVVGSSGILELCC